MVALKGVSIDNFANWVTSDHYIYQNKKTKQCMVHTGIKKKPVDGYEPLPLREIVYAGMSLKSELHDTSKAPLLSQAFMNMAKSKEAKEKLRNCLVRIMRMICDCLTNLFKGYGFKQTATLAKELADDLYHPTPKLPADSSITPQPKPEVTPTEKPSEAPPKTPQPPPLPSPFPPTGGAIPTITVSDQDLVPSTEELLIPVQPSASQPKAQPSPHLVPPEETSPKPGEPPIETPEAPKEPPQETAVIPKVLASEPYILNPKDANYKALTAYKNKKGSHVQRMTIYNNITCPVLPPMKVSSTIISVKDLVCFMAGTKEPNFNNQEERRVIKEIFQYCKKDNLIEDIIKWLFTEKTFNPDIAADCLGVLTAKEHHYNILQILEEISSRNWGSRIVNDAIANALKVLLQKDPSGCKFKKIDSLLSWFIALPQFDLDAFVILVRVFVEKYKENANNPNLYYPNLDRILVVYKNTNWKTLVEANPDLADVHFFLNVPAPQLDNKPLPPKAMSPKLVNSPKSKSEAVDLHVKETGQKIKFLKSYKEAPEKKSVVAKKAIFQDLYQVMDPNTALVSSPKGEAFFEEEGTVKPNEHAVVSVEQLVKYVSSNNSVDFSDKNCLVVIKDAITFCKGSTIEQLVPWLRQLPTFDVHGLHVCLDALQERAEKDHTCKYMIFELIAIYKEREWHNVISVNDSVIAKAIRSFLLNDINNEVTLKLITWVVEHMNHQTYQLLMQIFHEKHMLHSKANLSYAVEEVLLETYHKHPEWHTIAV